MHEYKQNDLLQPTNQICIETTKKWSSLCCIRKFLSRVVKEMIEPLFDGGDSRRKKLKTQETQQLKQKLKFWANLVLL